jgi:hypothetical protein
LLFNFYAIFDILNFLPLKGFLSCIVAVDVEGSSAELRRKLEKSNVDFDDELDVKGFLVNEAGLGILESMSTI